MPGIAPQETAEVTQAMIIFLKHSNNYTNSARLNSNTGALNRGH
jgi:hypothetical protein